MIPSGAGVGSLYRIDVSQERSDSALWSHLTVAKLYSWSGRAGFSVGDHLVLSGANFILNVLLARWLIVESYGVFALMFSGILVVMALHDALVLEPMSVFGPSRYAQDLRSYLSSHLILHARASLIWVASGGSAAAVAWALGKSDLASMITGPAVVAPPVLLYMVLRRYFYLLHRPHISLVGGVVYFAATIGGILLLRATGLLTPVTALLVMGLAASVAAFVLSLCAAPWREDRQVLPTAAVARLHWNYGRWLVAAGALSAVALHGQVFFAAALLGLRSAGAFRAMQILVQPVLQVVIAVAVLVLPLLAREFGRGNVRNLKRIGLIVGSLLTIAAVAYEVLLLVLHHRLTTVIFGDKFSEMSWLVPVLGGVGVLAAMTAGFSLVIRAVQNRSHYLVVAVSSAAIGVPAAVVLTGIWGLFGAAVSLLLTYLTSLIVNVLFVRRWFREVGLEMATDHEWA